MRTSTGINRLQFSLERGIGETLCKQIERLDIQRKRIINEIDGQEDISKKIRLEKLLFEIDYKVTGIISKVLDSNLQVDEIGSQETSKEKISSVVRKICCLVL